MAAASHQVIPVLASESEKLVRVPTVGVSKSSVSRQTIEASEAEVEALLSRRFDEVKLVILSTTS